MSGKMLELQAITLGYSYVGSAAPLTVTHDVSVVVKIDILVIEWNIAT